MNHEKTTKIICALFSVFATAAISAELNPLFQDNAVLQCDARVPVWGAARDGENITVAFVGQKVSIIAKNGVWKIWLKPMKPNALPQTLTVAGDTTSVVTNVLVGEVWVASCRTHPVVSIYSNHSKSWGFCHNECGCRCWPSGLFMANLLR